MKKVLVLLLAVSMIFTFAACTTETTTQQTTGTTIEGTTTGDATSSETEIELSEDGRYPAETVKIGFVNYDTSAEQVLTIQKYFEYLQTAFNFEIIWSESLGSAEEEFAFIEQCAAAGCQAIIGYYNEGKEESQKLTASLGMYYWGLAVCLKLMKLSKMTHTIWVHRPVPTTITSAMPSLRCWLPTMSTKSSS